MWKLIIGIQTHLISNEEKEYYMKCVNAGKQYCEIKGAILSTKFQTITQDDREQAYELIDQGMKKCQYGTWHNAIQECHCNQTLVMDEQNKRVFYVTDGHEDELNEYDRKLYDEVKKRSNELDKRIKLLKEGYVN